MIRYYENMGSDREANAADTPTSVTTTIDQMNTNVRKEYSQILEGRVVAQRRYSAFLREPIVPSSYAYKGENTSIRDRTIVNGPKKNSDIEAILASQPSGPFVSSRTSNLQGVIAHELNTPAFLNSL